MTEKNPETCACCGNLLAENERVVCKKETCRSFLRNTIDTFNAGIPEWEAEQLGTDELPLFDR